MASEILTAGMDADHEIIRRSQNQTFAAQMNQNLGFSLRCGQKMERGVDEMGLEESIATRPFDGVSTNYLAAHGRTMAMGNAASDVLILNLIDKALSAMPK